MRAFILRRVALLAEGSATWSCSARSHSAATLRIREFLTRNGQPFTYQDVETDPGVQALLDRFHVGVARGAGRRLPRAATCSRNPSHRGAGRRRSASAATLDADGGARRRHRRRRPGGAGGRGLRRLGGARRAGAREHRARRPGRHELAHRELPRLPDRDLGRGAGGARAAPRPRSSAPRSRSAARAVRLDCDSRPYAIHLADGEVRPHARDRRSPPARSYRRLDAAELAALRGRGRLLQRHPPRGAAVRRARRSPSSAAATPPARRRCSCRSIAAHVHVLVRGPGLAESMSRYLIQRIEGEPQHHAADAHQIDGAARATTASSACAGATSTPASPRRARSATSS